MKESYGYVCTIVECPYCEFNNEYEGDVQGGVKYCANCEQPFEIN